MVVMVWVMMAMVIMINMLQDSKPRPASVTRPQVCRNPYRMTHGVRLQLCLGQGRRMVVHLVMDMERCYAGLCAVCSCFHFECLDL